VENHLLELLGNHYDSSILDESEFQILLYCAKLKYKDTCDCDLNDNNVIHQAGLLLSRIMNKSPQDQIFQPLNIFSKQQIIQIEESKHTLQ